MRNSGIWSYFVTASLPLRRLRRFIASNLVEKKSIASTIKNLFLIFPHLQVDYFNRGLIDHGLDSHISDPAVQLKNADTFYKYLGWEVSTDKDRQNDMIKKK